MRKVIAIFFFMLMGLSAHAQDKILDTPIYTEVYVPGSGPRPMKVSGQLIKYNDTQFTLRIVREERVMEWGGITPNSAFTLRQRLIDKTKAGDWLSLGQFAWELGAQDQARVAFRQAVKLDSALKAQVDEILSKPAGGKSTKTVSENKGETKPDNELIKQSGESSNSKSSGGKDDRLKYAPATPAEAESAMKRRLAEKEEIAGELKLSLATIETDHFIIFTDWDAREHNFLKTNMEEAYRVVCRQFDMSPKDNIFVGKLPVYMLKNYSDFAKFADAVDEFPVGPTTAGYYHGNSRGEGHMVMWKPNESLTGSRDIKEAERLWAYVLVHEFTHAFLARYRTNVFVPRWLNEGVAEVIASSAVPRQGWVSRARNMAESGEDVLMLFDDRFMPKGEHYAVVHSMVHLLVQTDQKKFIKLIDDIKDGVKAEEALNTHYKLDYAGFADAWRVWAKKQNGR